MISTEASVSHDHDYCGSNVQDEKDLDFVVENLINSSSPKSMDAENIKGVDSLGLSPAYSCDSGIDSFANDLVQSFGGEGDDLLNFLLDDDFGLETELQGSINFTKNLNNTFVKAAKVDKTSTKTIKAPIVKKDTADTDEFERSRKNAENARENRRKKKLYVEGLEKEVGQLRNEKNVLMGKSSSLEKKVNELQNEVDYLKSVLANQSTLSKLIEGVSKTSGVSLSTSFCSSRQPSLEDNDESSLKDNSVEYEKENMVSTRSASRKRACDSQPATSAKRGRGTTNASGGICLHVKRSKVSIEFCRYCSKMAQD